MRILCIGINHKTAGVELRESVALDAAAAERQLRQLAERWEAAELVILSTCNRTEIYTARPVHGHPREHELRSWLSGLAGKRARAAAEASYALADGEALRHLFEVAAGLDSLIVGEPQITGQVKQAYAAAREAAVARAVMNRLFQAALNVAKRVRSETPIASGRASVASAAVDQAVKSLGTLAGKCVLVVGAGKMNLLMLRRIAEMAPAKVLVANRSPERADRLAVQFGGEAVGFGSLAEHLAAADVVLTSTAAEAPVITADLAAEALARRGGRELLIIDIAVPRDVEPAVAELENVTLFDIDDLERIVAANSKGRDERVAAARKIVDDKVAETLTELKIRQVAPTIDAVYRYMRRIADEEIETACNKLASHADADADKEILTRALHRAIRRIVHPVAKNLRKASAADAAGAHAASLRKLFGLDGD